jgi:hypothetical protein
MNVRSSYGSKKLNIFKLLIQSQPVSQHILSKQQNYIYMHEIYSNCLNNHHLRNPIECEIPEAVGPIGMQQYIEL